MRKKQVSIVIGANYGDEGKGQFTHELAIRDPQKTLVILSNGGAQRGHTVCTDSYRHVFSHFGSGTIAGAASYLPKEFIVNPIIFVREFNDLMSHNIRPFIYIDKQCLLTTFVDMMLNDIKRNIEKECNTVGVGIFETIKRNQNKRFRMTVGEFALLTNYNKRKQFLQKLMSEYFYIRSAELGLTDKNQLNEFLLRNFNQILYDNYINAFDIMMQNSCLMDSFYPIQFDHLVFENGQGLLLDQNNLADWPYLTPSNTGLKNPLEILQRFLYHADYHIYYISRSYLTRHGEGPFPTEWKKKEIPQTITTDKTNVTNYYQGGFRLGKLNETELRVRIENDLKNIGSINPFVSLVLTHLNEYSDIDLNELKKFRIIKSYNEKGD